MVDTVMTTESKLQTTQTMERLSWAILVGSFLLFGFICIGSTLGVYVFVFESSIPMNALVQVGRGTTVITNSDFVERGVRLQEDISGRVASVSTDSQSQSLLTLRLPSRSSDITEQVLMAVTLRSSTDVKLQRATVPRFDWSRGIYHVVLRDLRGKADITVLGRLPRELLIEVHTLRGETIYITQKGRYSIDVNDNRLRVVTLEGEAILLDVNRSNNRVIAKGMEGVIFSGRSEPSVVETRQNLLENGLFGLDVAIAEDSSSTLPGRWGCTNLQDSLPRGNYAINMWEGRFALRLVRSDGANSHGETRCLQTFPSEGLDISEYTYLELETSFLINYQSLSDCGIRGSECPMMLRIVYTDINGVSQEWFQGFYYATIAESNFPPRCESCSQDHVKINEKVWYTFSTGNLFNIIPPSNRPTRIKTIEFYASGHQYDLYVSEMGLYAGYVDIVPEVSGQGS